MLKALVGFFLFLILPLYNPLFAVENMPQEKRLETVVTAIKEEKTQELQGRKQLYQKLELMITSSTQKGEKIEVENGGLASETVQKYYVGDKLIITSAKGPDGKDIFFISDYIRRVPLYILFALFLAVTLLISRLRGALSFIGMILSFIVIFNFTLPQILLGNNPVMIAIFASLFIIPISYYLSHGINKKTTVAIIGTLISLIVTGILASIFVEFAKLTGYSEDAAFLNIAKEGVINMKGLLLAGIIISLSGILDDITISQSAIVYQLKKTAPTLSSKELYLKAMDIGKDHIASVVNTLILVYTGAALPLLLLFINSNLSFTEVINYELLAVEIVKTLVASIGLVLAVPTTTFIAVYSIRKLS